MAPEMRPQVAAMFTSVRALIDAPEKWTKYRMSLWRDGRPCFCLLGAMSSVHSQATLVYRETEGLLKALSYKRCGISQLGTFNDSAATTHADVISLIDAAIAEMS